MQTRISRTISDVVWIWNHSMHDLCGDLGVLLRVHLDGLHPWLGELLEVLRWGHRCVHGHVIQLPTHFSGVASRPRREVDGELGGLEARVAALEGAVHDGVSCVIENVHALLHLLSSRRGTCGHKIAFAKSIATMNRKSDNAAVNWTMECDSRDMML